MKKATISAKCYSIFRKLLLFKVYYKVKEVVFYFSSKPPQDVINRLLDIGVKVQWVPKG